MNKLVRKVHKTAHHRNGVMGAPFDIVLFTDTEGDEKIAILFSEPFACAVLSRTLLKDDVIEFAQNSWRGDEYEIELRKAIQKERGE